MQARVKLGLALLAAAFSGSVAAGMPVATESQNVNVGPIDVAKTPGPPAPPVPTPYPNSVHGMGAPDSQKEGSKAPVQGEAVLLKNGSVFKHSTGDEAGSATGNIQIQPVVKEPAPGAPSQGSGAKDVAENGPLKLGVSPGAARQTPKTDFGSVLGQGVSAGAAGRAAAGDAGGAGAAAVAAPFVPGGAVVSAAVSGGGGAAANAAGAAGAGGGGAAAVIPPVAKTPTPGGPVPIPYPNLPLVRPVQAPAPVTLPTPAPQPAVRAARPILQTQPALPVRR